MTEKEKFINQLYNDNSDFLLRLSRVYVNNEADAEDLAQEVFARAAKSVDKLMTHTNPRAWLVATLKYCVKNDSRLCSNTLNISLEEFGDLVAPEKAEPLSHILPGQLSAGDRDILIWRFEQRRSYREISRNLGISELACRVKVCRIIKRCRELMSK